MKTVEAAAGGGGEGKPRSTMAPKWSIPWMQTLATRSQPTHGHDQNARGAARHRGHNAAAAAAEVAAGEKPRSTSAPKWNVP